MKRTNRILPVYAADISGICSALYELGGMTVMHDASGCNSTYTTHDEPRWYSMDSMVYISALSELEAVMGDDEKLVRDIVDAALNLCPAFICIGGTPIPMMMGTDFKGIARMIENKTGIPTFGIATNGMHSYVRGAGEALRWIVKRFCPPGIKADRPAALKVNILGVSPLDFSLTGNTARLKDFLRSHGMETVGCWAMESGLDELRLAGLADVNLVVSAVGLPAAAELKKMYGTPWVVGTPVGRRTSGRLEGDIIDWDEDEVIRAIAESTVVVADPLYRQVCSAHRNIVFVDFPHEACSGRMYHSIMRPFVCALDDSV